MAKDINIINGTFKVQYSDGTDISFESSDEVHVYSPVLSAVFQGKFHHSVIKPIEDDNFTRGFSVSFDTEGQGTIADRVTFRIKILLNGVEINSVLPEGIILQTSAEVPKDFLEGIVDLDLVFKLPPNLDGLPMGCIRPLYESYEPCAIYQLTGDCENLVPQILPEENIVYPSVDFTIVQYPPAAYLNYEFTTNLNHQEENSLVTDLTLVESFKFEFDGLIAVPSSTSSHGPLELTISEDAIFINKPSQATQFPAYFDWPEKFYKDITKKQVCLKNIIMVYDGEEYELPGTEDNCDLVTLDNWWYLNEIHEYTQELELHPGQNYFSFYVLPWVESEPAFFENFSGVFNPLFGAAYGPSYDNTIFSWQGGDKDALDEFRLWYDYGLRIDSEKMGDGFTVCEDYLDRDTGTTTLDDGHQCYEFCLVQSWDFQRRLWFKHADNWLNPNSYSRDGQYHFETPLAEADWNINEYEYEDKYIQDIFYQEILKVKSGTYTGCTSLLYSFLNTYWTLGFAQGDQRINSQMESTLRLSGIANRFGNKGPFIDMTASCLDDDEDGGDCSRGFWNEPSFPTNGYIDFGNFPLDYQNYYDFMDFGGGFLADVNEYLYDDTGILPEKVHYKLTGRLHPFAYAEDFITDLPSPAGADRTPKYSKSDLIGDTPSQNRRKSNLTFYKTIDEDTPANLNKGWVRGYLPPCKEYVHKPLKTLISFEDTWREYIDAIIYESALVNAVDFDADDLSDTWLGTLVELYAGMGFVITQKGYGYDETTVAYKQHYDSCLVCSDGDTLHTPDAEVDYFAQQELDAGTFNPDDTIEDGQSYQACCYYPYEVETYYKSCTNDDIICTREGGIHTEIEEYGRSFLQSYNFCNIYSDVVEYPTGSGDLYYKKFTDCPPTEYADILGNCLKSYESGNVVDSFGNVCLEGNIDLCGVCFGDSTSCQDDYDCPYIGYQALTEIEYQLSEDGLLYIDGKNTGQLQVHIYNDTPLTNISFEVTGIQVSNIELKDEGNVDVTSFFEVIYSLTPDNTTRIVIASTNTDYIIENDIVSPYDIHINFDDVIYDDIIEITNPEVSFFGIGFNTAIREGTGAIELDEIHGCTFADSPNYNEFANHDCDGTPTYDCIEEGCNLDCCEFNLMSCLGVDTEGQPIQPIGTPDEFIPGINHNVHVIDFCGQCSPQPLVNNGSECVGNLYCDDDVISSEDTPMCTGIISCDGTTNYEYDWSLFDCAGVCNGGSYLDVNPLTSEDQCCGGTGGEVIEVEPPPDVEPEPMCDEADTESGCPDHKFCYYSTCYTMGDLDLDGTVTILDIVLLLGFALETNTPEEYYDTGCTDETADNYNPDATVNDGSCEYPDVILGCLDDDAINYNSDATIDDGSCEYEDVIPVPYPTIMFTEIHPATNQNPITDEKYVGEWVELYNPNDFEVDITGYRFVGTNDEEIKYINFEICDGGKPLLGDCGGGNGCTLQPGEFLVLYERTKEASYTYENYTDQNATMHNNVTCYQEGFNDADQPANIAGCGDELEGINDCSHIDGGEDTLAIFDGDPTGNDGQWDGSDISPYANLINIFSFNNLSHNGTTSSSLTNPLCINHGAYYDDMGQENWIATTGAQRSPGNALFFDESNCTYGTWDNPIVDDDEEPEEEIIESPCECLSDGTNCHRPGYYNYDLDDIDDGNAADYPSYVTEVNGDRLCQIKDVKNKGCVETYGTDTDCYLKIRCIGDSNPFTDDDVGVEVDVSLSDEALVYNTDFPNISGRWYVCANTDMDSNDFNLCCHPDSPTEGNYCATACMDRLGYDSGTPPPQQQTFTSQPKRIGRTTPSRQQTQRQSDYFQTSCWSTGHPNYEWNYTHPQAEWCYSQQIEGQTWPRNFYTLYGTIYIDGEPSSNPATEPYIPDYHNYQGDWPNVCMNGWMNPTDNCDVVALLWQWDSVGLSGNIIGFDFVNNQSEMSTQIPAQHQWSGGYYEGGLDYYPQIGDKPTNLILYRGRTGTYHYLTDESYNDFFNGTWQNSDNEWVEGIPPLVSSSIGMPHHLTGANGAFLDLHFGPALDIEGAPILGVHGDITGDGLVNISDIQYMVAMIRTGVSPEQIYQNVPEADLNGDGQVDVTDLQILINTILSDSRTSSSDKQKLQKQLDRLGYDSGTPPPQQQTFTSQPKRIGRTKQLSPLENQLFTDEIVNILNQLNIIIEENLEPDDSNQELIQRVQNILPINAIKSKVKSNIKKLSYANRLKNNSAKRTIAPDIQRDLCSVCDGGITECMQDNTAWNPVECGYYVDGADITLENFDSWIDCNGDCFGEAVVDDCGQCCGGNTGRVCNDKIACDGSVHPRTEHPNLDCNCECYGVTPIINSIQEMNGETYPSEPDSVYDVYSNLGTYTCCNTSQLNNYYPDYDSDDLGCGQILGPDGLTYINVDPIKVCNNTDPVSYAGVQYVNNSSDTDCQCPDGEPVDACGICGGANDCVGCKDDTALNYCEECTIDCNDSFFDCCIYSDPTSSGQSFQNFSTRLETYYDKPTDDTVCVTFENPNGTDIGLPESYFIHSEVESGTQYCMELSYSHYESGTMNGANDNTYGYLDGEWEAMIPGYGYYTSITCCLDPGQENLDEWLMTNHGPESDDADIEDRLPTLLDEYGKTEFPTQTISTPFDQNTLFNESIVSYIYHQGQSILVKDISEYIYTQDPVAYCNGNGFEKLLDCFEEGGLDDIKLNLTDSDALNYQIAWENNGNKIIATWIGPQFCGFISCDEVNTNYQVLNLNTAETGVSGEISSGQGISIRFLPPFSGEYYYKLIY